MFIGLCTEDREIKSSIVLAGDPKQLGAVTKSDYAKRLGYNLSYMEFLFNQNCYKPNSKTGKYNPRFIVQLTENYRNHRAILHTSNKLFYNNNLQCEASTGLFYKMYLITIELLETDHYRSFYSLDITDTFIGTDLLPNKKFPIIFESVCGICKRPDNSSSSYNKQEVNIVIDYITKILKNKWNGQEILLSDIGIISPYRAQCEQIQNQCQRLQYDKVTIGTAETFQGQERKIIIISMVRSDGKLTDFVIDERVKFRLPISLILKLIHLFLFLTEIKCDDNSSYLTLDSDRRS